MEQHLNEAEVWARVRAASPYRTQTAEAAETAEAADDSLVSMLQQAGLAADTYRQLLRRTRGETHKCLRQLWEDTCRQRRQLAAIYYVTTGSTVLPPTASVLPMLTEKELLRQLCAMSVRQAEQYADAAEDGPFARQFHNLHAAVCRHIPVLLSVLSRYL